MPWTTRREKRLLRRFHRVWQEGRELPGPEAAALLVEEVGHLRTDDEIAMFAVQVLEAIVDARGVELRDEFAAALRRSPKLRQAYRDSIVHIPTPVDDELRSIAVLA
jgi:hypothetical protein